ncbi:hypothetical protein NDU88_001317 [Pleurodeles waltl]|uniref:Uncharacterized protein n=1 Tax=Pleurodeles waltl TaxID=8319 RepID=A0AAV7LZ10_PLEWA|nr:hypothetical protein NDU88_001317 [Pleurodeles waltl]
MNHFTTVCHRGTRGKRAHDRRPITSTVRHLSLGDPGQLELDQQGRKWKNAYEDSSPEEEVFLISFSNDLKKRHRPRPTCVFDIVGSHVKVLIDMCASVNVMSI